MVGCLKRTRQHGQALVELGIVIVLIVTLAMGIIEFGRMFMIINMITNAAREGARVASVMQDSGRNASKQLTPSCSNIANMVRDQIRNVVASTAGMTVTTAQECAPGTTIPTVKVTVGGSIPYLFAILPGSSTGLSVNRQITFGDEGC